MAVEILEEPPLTPPVELGPYRRRDYDELPDEPRCELLFGRLYAMPGPSLLHQAVVQTMWLHLKEIAQVAGGRAYLAPLDVALADHSVVQPDVMYVSPERFAVLQRRIEGAPDLLVEVVSPRTAGRDRVYKLMLYAASGVREYWIVDAEARVIQFLVNETGRFVVAMPAGEKYQSQSLPGVHLDIAELWRQVETQLPPAPPAR
jgi:Uma2 family endonuclease